jgi:hypothetical protein
MWQNYCDIVATKDTNREAIQQLATDILNPATGVRAQLRAITQAFTGDAATGDVSLAGMFATFAQDQGEVPQFDDRVPYEQIIEPYTAHFASLLVMGMTLVTEAWHIQHNNTEAGQAIDDIWADIRAVFKAGGYPLSTSTVVTDTASQAA